MDRSPTKISFRAARFFRFSGAGLLLMGALALGGCEAMPLDGNGSGAGGAVGTVAPTAGAGGQGGAATEVTAKIDPRLLANATADQPQEVVVMLDEQAIPTAAIDQTIATSTNSNQIAALSARLGAAKDQMIDRLRAQPIVALNRLTNLPAMHVRVDSTAALMALAGDPAVGRLVANDVHELMDTVPADLTLINQPQAAAAGKLGAGATVAVLDTGADFKRAPFNCASAGATGCPIVYAADIAPNDNNVDDNGHGTNVSGIVHAVAPSAKLIALDVFNGATAWTTDIMSAIDWCIQNKAKYNIVSINMSLGGGTSTTTCPSDPLAVSISSARAAGILSAVASGNSGNLNAISSPACGPDAVSVGAVHAANLGNLQWSNCGDATTSADKVACFSCSSSFLTMLAPGVMITAAGITMSGTSQATPHVAGALAVLAAAFPSETPTQLVSRLTTYGVPVKDARNGITKPRLDLMASLNGAASGGPTPPVTSTPTVGPTGTITLNAKATFTKTAAVTAALAVTSGTAAQVCLSEAGSCTAWAATSASRAFTLSKGDGTKTVNAWWKDAKGNVSASPASASITVDSTAPTGGTITASGVGLQAMLTWSGFTDAGSGVAGYRLVTGTSTRATSCTGTATYEGTATTFSKTLTAAGTLYARVCAKDAIGNINTGATTTIALKPATHAASFTAGAATAEVGNPTGGTATADSCPAGQALIGFSGSLSTSTTAGVHRQIRAICGTVSVTGTVVAVAPGSTLPARGPSGTFAWTRTCAANQVVVSFAGRSGALVDQLTFTCAPLTAAASTAGSALNMGTVKALAAIGGTGGTAFTATKCATGQVATSMSVRTGDNMDSFSLGCGKATVGN
ncbi:MAG TPA: S8 family serine peptidase [Polyangia bacterium]|jgi:subtilisin family serine protease